MSNALKNPFIWFALIVLIAFSGLAIWFKLAADAAPQTIEDPGIPDDLEIPEDIPVE